MSRLPQPASRRLFVSVGTDHHTFDRLVGWAGRWAAELPAWRVAVQHGFTAAPPDSPHGNLDAFDFCDRDRLLALFAGSDVVVTHGGPATITEARRQGHVPVVCPRDPAFGEHVDDHQVLFSARLAAGGLVTLARSVDDLADAVLAAHRTPAGERSAEALPPGVMQVGRIAEGLALRARARRR